MARGTMSRIKNQGIVSEDPGGVTNDKTNVADSGIVSKGTVLERLNNRLAGMVKKRKKSFAEFSNERLKESKPKNLEIVIHDQKEKESSIPEQKE